MASVTRDQVLEQLKKIHGPDGKGDLVSSGVVENVLVNDGKVIFSLSVAADRAKQLEPLRALAEQAVHAREVQDAPDEVGRAEDMQHQRRTVQHGDGQQAEQRQRRDLDEVAVRADARQHVRIAPVAQIDALLLAHQPDAQHQERIENQAERDVERDDLEQCHGGFPF